MAAARLSNQKNNNRYGGQSKNTSGYSKAAPLDESNFNCEVPPDQDDNQMPSNKDVLGDNYQMPQRATLDEVK